MLISIEDMLFIYLPKILLAIFCGSLIGLERELKDKPAGIKTYMLICTGAAIFTMMGMAFTEFFTPSGEPSRVAAQVVTGVGFLGAGTIIFARGHVKGLTSAAAIWLSAAIGMSIGVGFYVFSVAVTLVCIIALVLVGKLEERLGLKIKKEYDVRIKLTEQESINKLTAMIGRTRGQCKIVEMKREEFATSITISCILSDRELLNFQKAMSQLSGDYTLRLE